MSLTCPKCSSANVTVQAVSNTQGKTKGFGCIKSILGILIAGPFGFFCGLCGMGKGKITTTIESVKLCQNCGNTFWQVGVCLLILNSNSIRLPSTSWTQFFLRVFTISFVCSMHWNCHRAIIRRGTYGQFITSVHWHQPYWTHLFWCPGFYYTNGNWLEFAVFLSRLFDEFPKIN